MIYLHSEPSPETDESDVGTRDPSLKRTYVGLPNIRWICCHLLFKFCWFLPLLAVGQYASFHGPRSKVLVNPHIVVSSTLCQIWIKGSKTQLSFILKHVLILHHQALSLCSDFHPARKVFKRSAQKSSRVFHWNRQPDPFPSCWGRSADYIYFCRNCG